jgi:hypothetical protein
MRLQARAGDDTTHRKTRMIVGGKEAFYVTPYSVAKEQIQMMPLLTDSFTSY